MRSREDDTREDEPPLSIRPVPPTTERIDKKKLVLVCGTLGAALILMFGIKLQGKHAAQQVIQPPPLPGPHEVSGDVALDQILKIPTSYEGMDRRPPPSPPPPPHDEPPPPVAAMPALPPMANTPPPPPPTPVPHVQTPGPAPEFKPPPKKWLFADLENTVAKPPFPRPEREGEDESAASGPTLVQQAQWVTPRDPTKVLYRSQVIPGTLLHALNSDIPGPVRILVTRPVTDRFQQGHVLIPQHSILLGMQEGRPSFGQTRLAVTIDEIQFPDGTIVHLKGQMADRSGALGATGKVNNHYVKLGVAAVLSAALNIGARGLVGTPRGFHPTLEQEFARDVGESVHRTGQSIVDRALNIPPTITLTAGTEVTVQVSENLSFHTPPAVVK